MIAAWLRVRFERIVERLASCIPDCRLVELPVVTHVVSYQAPNPFKDTFLAFLARPCRES